MNCTFLDDNKIIIGDNVVIGAGSVVTKDIPCNGYGSEASKAMVEYMFKQGVHRIYSECAPQNTASWKLMSKIGMEREAYFKKNVSFHKDANGDPIYWDTYVYALLNPYEEGTKDK